jgi:hypothetical protein
MQMDIREEADGGYFGASEFNLRASWGTTERNFVSLGGAIPASGLGGICTG